jgi:DNA helicase II / ATP-dependent DNA helicase PcrA
LTQHQMRAVNHPGNFFLTACPGSGKTRSASARVASLMASGQRVAACSYTNIGTQQISSLLGGPLSTVVPSGSFVGTLHSFLLTYVFYPFANLVTGCHGSHRLLLDGASQGTDVTLGRNNLRAHVALFRFRPDGSVVFRGTLPHGMNTLDRVTILGGAAATRLKIAAAANGVVTMDDSMYWALQVLRQRPELAAAVAARFDELLVDEAQDTSELQIACLCALKATGKLRSLVLVGDLDQSIYSFNGASPSGLAGLVATSQLETVPLTENHRSSQRICDATARFRPNPTPDTAVGEHRACPWPPELILYDAGRPGDSIDRFAVRLAGLRIDSGHAAVLARANLFVDELNGNSSLELPRRIKDLVQAAAIHQASGTFTRRDFERVEDVVAYVAWGMRASDVPASQAEGLRATAVALVSSLPRGDCDFQTWTRSAAAAVGAAVRQLVDPPAHPAGTTIRAKADWSQVRAADILAPPRRALVARTIHHVKGETIEAVLAVATPTASPRHPPQSTSWSPQHVTLPNEDPEEVRVIYVALTRAQRYCAIAISNATPQGTIDRYTSGGFVISPVSTPAQY